MTFTEAAVEVLRLVGKPLHYKKITEVAIERNLLSHVGKTPEVTMSSRLATMVKRDRGEAPIIKVKPGVFGLREFNEEQLADLSGDVDELPEVEVENEQDKALEAQAGAVELPSILPSIEPRKPLPGADVFPEEDDDDEPILGGDDDDDDEEEGEGEEAAGGAATPGSAESRSSRRRRKRRRRGGAEEAAEPEAVRPAREPREALPAREPREPRHAREPRLSARAPEGALRRDERSRETRGRDHRDEPRRDERSSRDQHRDERGRDSLARGDGARFDREREEPLDFSREPGDGDLLGKDLADAVASVLTQGGPRGLPVLRIADQLVRRGRLSGDPGALVPTIMAAVRADIARKRIEQTRPRFKAEAGAVVLTEFLLPQDVVRAEQDVLRAAERQRERVRRAFLRRLGELPGAGMAELIATWLNAEGVVGLRAVRRPGAGVGELHLAGTLRRGADELRLAIVVHREARELSRERVIEARGALHYYGNAQVSWLITFGSVTAGAREEASAPAAGPVALYDGLSLATAMERQGVGLATQQVAISALDFELLDALRGGQAPRDFDQERGRGRDRDRDREREAGPRDITPRDRGERSDRTDRDRNERGERTERGDRNERPRLTLERARPALEEAELEPELNEEEGDVTLDEGDEVIDAALQEAAPSSGEAGEEGEAREGSRRRRRRRRRKGGRPGEAQAEGEAEVSAEEGESAVEGAPEGDGDVEREPAPWGEEPDESEALGRDDYARADGEQSSEYGAEQRSGERSDDETSRDDDERDDELDRERDERDERDDVDDERDEESDEESDEERERREDDEASERSGTDDARDREDGDAAEPDREQNQGETDADPDDETRDPYPGRRGHG